MEVTRLTVDTTKKKVNVYLNDSYVFWLSTKEINKLDLKVGQEITSERLNNIMENIVLKRAKSKALSLLKYSDRTESEMKEKLEREGYLEELRDKVIDFLKEYNYINDFRYACHYIDMKKESKSPMQIKYSLKKKGIDEDVLHRALNEVAISEEQVLSELVQKRMRIKRNDSKENRQRLYHYFVRKGFNPTLVMKLIKEYEQNNDTIL